MFGLLGNSVIGLDPLTGPTAHGEDKTARLARHQVVRGKPVVQDLGDDATTQTLSFFFDETFCEPEDELRKLQRSYAARTTIRLFADSIGLQSGTFVIERMSIRRQKTNKRGKVVRVEIEAELLEATSSLVTTLLGVAANAILNPLLKRG